MKIRIIIVFTLAFLNLTTCAQNSSKNKSYNIIVPDLNIPWGFTFLPDNSLLITEKAGKLLHFKNGITKEISGLPEIYVRGQGGLMDIVLHPNYNENGWVYISFASSAGNGKGGHTAIMRGKIKNSQFTDKQLLYKASPNSTSGQHFGSRLAFDNNGYLYFSIGERGDRDTNPQDITRDGGKIYRLHDDGRIPKDNPFYNAPNAKQAIYSYGHRNPQGLAIHPETGELWSHEHGPKGGDEINIINKGKNYGWPKITYGRNYSGSKITDKTALPGMEQPLHYWDPSIAPCGMVFISSDIYPKWKGNVLVGSLKFQYLDNIYLKNNTVTKEEKLLEGLGRLRSIGIGPDGYIYAGIENLGIVKINP
ncbi:PQQ-dependent sugar dehydrogenase [Hanstruepera flava]|uniref:PQQ-dependent sugar dehydrogenase n=1 Tax=Hanstruepera flava TaxID=2930218 RepID=UPI002028D965|nr:PQQ-dependent sugar dehydrogenase [Hanstruepera flava]